MQSAINPKSGATKTVNNFTVTHTLQCHQIQFTHHFCPSGYTTTLNFGGKYFRIICMIYIYEKYSIT